MRVYKYPDSSELVTIATRPVNSGVDMNALIREVFSVIRKGGDEALRNLTAKFDKTSISDFKVEQKEFDESEKLLNNELKDAINIAAENIRKFHLGQITEEQVTETMPGVTCSRRSVAIERVGLYVPGGTAPLFSTVLMLGIPASVAGCKEIVLCTPPARNGRINPAILYAARIAGVEHVFKCGGSQAIAAMALGTESIPKVDKLFGPGNSYVMAAKQFAQHLGVAIDMPAGPSEVLVAADNSVPKEFIAADLLAQAEHGEDSQVVLLSDDEDFISEIIKELKLQMSDLPRNYIAAEAIRNSISIIEKPENWARIINEYAPEHLMLMGKYEALVLPDVVNAGSIFLGEYTAESFGDYASGTNHTLPTAGFARSYSGVSVDSFVKKITAQRISREGLLNLGTTVVIMAEAENLHGHANAVKVRLNAVNKESNAGK